MGDDNMAAKAMAADLNRQRQEELPLNNEEKRGPSFAPHRNNGADHYSKHRKVQLKGRWNTKIEDEESKQMEGLTDYDPRPWAHKEATRVLKTFEAKSDRNVRSPLQATWGPPPISSNPPTTPLEPLPTNGISSSGAVAPSSSVNGTSQVRLVFTKNQAPPALNAAEYVAGSGQCHIVPGKNKALSYITKLLIKLRMSENEGVLELRSDLKGDKIHNALAMDKPILEGDYCVVKVKAMEWPYYLRFDTTEEARKFKHCLSSLQKSIRQHQKQDSTNYSQADTTNEADINTFSTTETPQSMASETATPKVEQLQPDKTDTNASGSTTSSGATMPAGPVPTCASDISTSTAVEQPGTLIAMNEGWGLVENNSLPEIDQISKHVIGLVDKVISHIQEERLLGAEEIAGINDAIFDKWMSEGFLRGCNDHLKQEFMKAIRSLVSLHFSLHSHFTGTVLSDKAKENQYPDSGINVPKVDNNNSVNNPTVIPHDQNGSVTSSERGALKGLSSSRFAKKAAAFQGSFTGVRPCNRNYW
ncbi:hypothetical protein QYS62_004893 [Fusarium acuminatum]|uniref:PH domain-containing protein n=1 Tax=Fusarium acuminatum TaxID=5515 RepID=A0ABZ2WVE1_9HYPO